MRRRVPCEFCEEKHPHHLGSCPNLPKGWEQDDDKEASRTDGGYWVGDCSCTRPEKDDAARVSPSVDLRRGKWRALVAVYWQMRSFDETEWEPWESFCGAMPAFYVGTFPTSQEAIREADKYARSLARKLRGLHVVQLIREEIIRRANKPRTAIRVHPMRALRILVENEEKKKAGRSH